jgi:DNA-directed RNA polymerase subunit RPC12/RpoP
MATRAATDLDLIRGTFGDPKTGILGAVVPNGEVFIPGGPVTIAPKSTLRWEVRCPSASYKTPTRAMFDSFIGLWQEPDSDERIRRFAERWGPLAIQGDGTHLDAGKWERVDREVYYGWDSLEAWKYCSRRAYSVLKIAAELQHGRRGNEREWLMLSSPQKAGPEPVCPQAPFGFSNHARRELVNFVRMEYGRELSLEGLKDVIAGEISGWLERFGVKLRVTWAPRFNWQLEISFHGWLLSAVALQLALAVMHADGLYVCSECNRLYARSGKRPNAGEKNYCPKCGRAKAVENAGRRLQQRRVEARRLHRIEGKSATEIAKLLGVRKVETVRGWIAKGKRDAQKHEAQTTQARPR